MNKVVVTAPEHGGRSSENVPARGFPVPDRNPAPLARATTGQDLATALHELLLGGAGALDLGGREIAIDGPIPLAAGQRIHPYARRTIRNGRILCRPGPGWQPLTLQSTANFATGDPRKLTNVAGAADVPVGAMVTGRGVGREVYVMAHGPAAGELKLSQPLWGADATQAYGFTRFRYALDFAALDRLGDLTFEDLEIDCGGVASGISLPVSGGGIMFRNCSLTGIGDRGVTSIGDACQQLVLDRCRIDGCRRGAFALNVNGDDATLRGSRFAAPVVLGGHGHLLEGNTFDTALALTCAVSGAVLTGNRFRDAALELTDEHCATPGLEAAGAIGGLSVTGNLFTASDPAPAFRWIVIRPHGPGHVLSNLSIAGNSFGATGTQAQRVETVDTAHADLDLTRTQAVTFHGNVFLGVDQPAMNPATLEFDQAASASVWTLNVGAFLPFGGHARTVTSVATLGEIRTAAGERLTGMPSSSGNAGPRRHYVQLVWPESCRGKVVVTARIDRPG